eukprot:gene21383-23469_t
MLKRCLFSSSRAYLLLGKPTSQSCSNSALASSIRLFSEAANLSEDKTCTGKFKLIEYKSGPSHADKITLQADKYGASLAQCVSSDFAMDKGLAKQFKKAFGNIETLKQQGVKPGGAAILPYKDSFIYYLVTRERWWDRGCYKYLRSALADVRHHCEANRVVDLRMGRLGAGPDGLDWYEIEMWSNCEQIVDEISFYLSIDPSGFNDGCVRLSLGFL